MSIDLEELYLIQKDLDANIAKNHNITYESTRTRRLLALLVEISELLNSTRVFKYWSNKSGEDKSRILDEYADGLHFYLSLGIDIKTNKMSYEIYDTHKEINEQFLEVYKSCDDFIKDQNEINYIKGFQEFLNLSIQLGFSVDDIIKGYKQKVEVNYIRQTNSY